VEIDSGWQGDLDDDCTLERYGMLAHVEAMDRNVWWFAISPLPWVPGRVDLFNTADNETHVKLTTGKMARATAECCMELLRRGIPSDASDQSWHNRKIIDTAKAL
jgi:hypothetical protein